MGGIEKTIQVQLCFDAQFIGSYDKVVEYPSNVTDSEIIESFEQHMNLKYDKNCYFKRLN